MTEEDEQLTTAQAAEALGVGASRVRQLILANRLPAQKIGRDLWIWRSDLAQVLYRTRTGRKKTKKDENTVDKS